MTWISSLGLSATKSIVKSVRSVKIGRKKGIQILNAQKKRLKRDTIRKGCNHTYRICEELSLSCNRNQWDLDPDGLWAEHEKGIDDWLTKEIRVNRK